VTNLDGAGHQRLVMDAPSFAFRASTDPRFIDLDMLTHNAADAVGVGTDHSGAQLVECNATITKAAYRQLNWPNRTVIE
jgi:hypothetical protein